MDLRPHSFAIHVTYTCPLTCAHCCFNSSPSNRDRLPLEVVLSTIRRLDVTDIKMMAFTGGEPFLLGKDLCVAIKLANSRGLITRVVTSAFFGKRQEDAKKILADVADAGLDELSISWDDYHEQFVSFECVYNVFHTATELGLRPAISIVQGASSRWTAERVRAELGLSAECEQVICEAPLNKTGRAEKELREAGLRASRSIGPCPYVMTGPTLSAKNKLLACCRSHSKHRCTDD